MSTPKIDRSDLLQQKMLQKFHQTQRSDGQKDMGVSREPGTGATGAAKGGGEKLEISASARRLEELRQLLAVGREALSRVPDVREDRIAAVRQKIAVGEYQDPEIKQHMGAKLSALTQRMDKLLG